MTERERNDTKMATLYELQLLLKKRAKKEYTLEEILELIDTIAEAKDQEMQLKAPFVWGFVYAKNYIKLVLKTIDKLTKMFYNSICEKFQ